MPPGWAPGSKMGRKLRESQKIIMVDTAGREERAGTGKVQQIFFFFLFFFPPLHYKTWHRQKNLPRSMANPVLRVEPSVFAFKPGECGTLVPTEAGLFLRAICFSLFDSSLFFFFSPPSLLLPPSFPLKQWFRFAGLNAK